ncbi:hypothetical protein ABEY61_25790 [Bacillus toyonensis]
MPVVLAILGAIVSSGVGYGVKKGLETVNDPRYNYKSPWGFNFNI